jgi:hypothetical protein
MYACEYSVAAMWKRIPERALWTCLGLGATGAVVLLGFDIRDFQSPLLGALLACVVVIGATRLAAKHLIGETEDGTSADIYRSAVCVGIGGFIGIASLLWSMSQTDKQANTVEPGVLTAPGVDINRLVVDCFKLNSDIRLFISDREKSRPRIFSRRNQYEADNEINSRYALETMTRFRNQYGSRIIDLRNRMSEIDIHNRILEISDFTFEHPIGWFDIQDIRTSIELMCIGAERKANGTR